MSLFNSTSREQRFAMRVGLFVALALALAGIIVFLIGRETQLFESQVTYRAYFENVEGLSEKSPVWLSGLEVGRVEAVTFPSVPGEKRLELRLRMSAEHAARVREDSVARLANRGVLGDKAVDISIGSLDQPQIPPGGRIPSIEGGDLTSLLRGASRVMDDTVEMSRTLREAVSLYADPELAEDVAASMRSLRGLLREVKEGDGVLHALIYDEEAGRRVPTLLANASRVALRVDQALGHVEALLKEVRTGDGTAHALIYDDGGARSLRELGAAAGQLAELLEASKRNPGSAVYQLVHGDSGDMLADLGSAAESLKEIMATVERGEGSLGALIKDPTVYEDLRTVLGNVKRNRVLRALVRLSISNQGALKGVGQPLESLPPPDESGLGIGGGPREEPAPLLPLLEGSSEGGGGEPKR